MVVKNNRHNTHIVKNNDKHETESTSKIVANEVDPAKQLAELRRKIKEVREQEKAVREAAKANKSGQRVEVVDRWLKIFIDREQRQKARLEKTQATIKTLAERKEKLEATTAKKEKSAAA